ncbi:MAG: hypothetical protein WBD22_04430 [Pyrinomonadaceae bacterium]
MKHITIAAISVLFFLQASCVQSLNPLYTEQDLTFDDKLIGVWGETDTLETWDFSKSSKLEYKLVQTDENGRKGEFSARLVNVKGEMFLDIVPIKTGFIQSDFYKDNLVATHTFAHIKVMGPTVYVSLIESGWLNKTVASDSGAIRHVKIADETLITSGPKEIQNFLVENLKTKGAFSKPLELTRKR